MEAITGEIEKALAAGLYFLAIVSTLTLPDICSALESPNGETTRQKYKDWCDAWISMYPEITSLDLWSLRCGVLHQGRLGHAAMQYGRILFTVPNRNGNFFHRNVINDALNLDAITFCRDVLQCVAVWYAAKQSDIHVQANLPRLLKFRLNGLAPYMVGIPLIA